MTTKNGAAERLRRLVQEHPMYEGDVDDALATKRLNTVERIGSERIERLRGWASSRRSRAPVVAGWERF